MSCAAKRNENTGLRIRAPNTRKHSPALDSAPAVIPSDANQFYIHDVVVSERLRGGGYARIAVNKLLDVGKEYPSIALISVYGTTGFWKRFEFRESPLPDPCKLLPYGEDAVFMVRKLDR